jgi:uncharacterized phage protein (TIGR01671 family)
MEDRLKFRIWDNKEKRYVEEYLDREIMLSIDGTLNACAYDFSGNRSIEDINKNNRFEVEFCTGLKDKNGQLIYENDLIKIDDDVAVIKWSDYYARFMLESSEDNFDFETTYAEECEIIGNIHENADLLGEE